MGKSPGRWIKTVLFGKKHSKSNLSKNAKPSKQAAAELAVEDLSRDSPVISGPFVVTDNSAEALEAEKNTTSDAPCSTVAVESSNNFVLVPASDAEMTRQGQAAVKVQAAVRGYLACRAFRTLKGIIRLQALIRGHLVRRQAVATLHCIQAVIKFQALVRGRRVRLSEIVPDRPKKCNRGELQVDIVANSNLRLEELATNAYIHKLLLSLPRAMPLSLRYDVAEPNSACSWLERWSLSHFWDPPVRLRKVSDPKHQRKLDSSQVAENETVKSRRYVRKAGHVDNGALASLDLDKPRRNSRVTSHQTELVHEQPQNELERVKCNLRKVSSMVTAASDESGTKAGKPEQKPSTKTVLNNAIPLVSESEILISAETPTNSDIVHKQPLVESSLKMTVSDEPADIPHDGYPLMESHSSENVAKREKMTIVHDEIGSKEDEIRKENQKIRKRRAVPARQEFAENISDNTPRLPSYMAATESAKAKLRAQGSPKFNEDVVEHGYVRRHSLPASTNGKLNSSPRMQKPVQANGKGNSESNRLTSYRQDKTLQMGWRR